MAANKVASMIHRNTNKIILLLVYAFLEWTLILLLLLNSIFSYLIIRFADYFGLKRPCLWCSRLDHIFDPTKKPTSYGDLLCDNHAMEISKLGFCCNHRKMAQSQHMCEDCSSSSDFSNEFAYFPWMKQIGVVHNSFDDKLVENGDVDLIKCCSCCGVSIDRRVFRPCVLLEPDWVNLDYTHKGRPIQVEEIHEGIQTNSHQILSASALLHQGDEWRSKEDVGNYADSDHTQRGDLNKGEQFNEKIGEGIQTPDDEHKDEQRQGIQIVSKFEGEKEEETVEEFSCFISSFDCNDEIIDRKGDSEVDLVLEEREEENKDVELAVEKNVFKSCSDEVSEAVSKHLEFYIDGQDCHLIPIELYKSDRVEDQRMCDDNGDVVLDFNVQAGKQTDLDLENMHFSEQKVILDSSGEPKQEDEAAPMLEPAEINTNGVKSGEEVETDSNQFQGSEDDFLHMQNDDEADAEISIGTEIPDHEQIDDIPSHEITPEDDDGHGLDQFEVLEFNTVTIGMKKPVINGRNQLYSQIHEFEEEKFPGKPSSVDSLHNLNKGLLLLDQKESGTEESLDSLSVTSEIECPDGVLTIEKLKSALREERKALNALYAELEEERSASAIAANHTMAMINRIQEQKAAMQMEALQYQRMMEEQSEYDQEALQLLSELMVKREREKAELEKELEVCRKKVEEFEAKEKIGMLRRRRRNSLGSCSNTEETDGLSVDLKQESKEVDRDKDKDCSFHEHDDTGKQKSTPVNTVLCLEESLADFEEERISILEQLKVLEEKLFALNGEEDGEDNYEDVQPTENGNGHFEENGNDHFDSKETINGKHKVLKSKRLLPLFNAAEEETENGLLNGNDHEENGIDYSENSSVGKSEGEIKKLAIEVEIDELYERLQGLEADREFLRHCLCSLSKGNKGVHLLQEILQNLRELRSVELRVRNMGDFSL